MVTVSDEPATLRFATETLDVQKTTVGDVPATWVHLSNSQMVRVSVLSDRQPLARPEPPDSTQLTIEARHGYYLATLFMPLTTEALEAGTRFLDNWLPQPSDRTRYALSGDLTDDRVAEIGASLRRADAPGAGLDPTAAPAVTSLTSPLPGQVDYEAFVIAMDLLRRRLGGYNAQLRWDHSERHSRALMNITLAPDQRGLPTEGQFSQALERRRADLARRELTAEQIHRQVVTLAAYDLPPAILTERQEALRDLDFDTFVNYWEVWFGSAH